MRRNELLSLTWEQIRKGFIYLTETKSGKARQIPINDRLAEVFREVRGEITLNLLMCFATPRGGGFWK
jgi:integrase